jgi:predicted PurR-regulated permease PerM
VSGTDVVLVALTGVCLLAVVALTVTVVQLRQLVQQMKAELDRSVPAGEELADAARRAAVQVDRLENLISVASSVTGTVDTATAATVRVLSNPVIKTAAIARGTRKAARRLTSAEEG